MESPSVRDSLGRHSSRMEVCSSEGRERLGLDRRDPGSTRFDEGEEMMGDGIMPT